MQQVKDWLSANVDKKVVISGVVTALVIGVAVMAMNKSGIKALQSAAKVVK